MEILQTDTLDTSWFDEYDKLLNLQNYFQKEKLQSIDIKFFYIYGHVCLTNKKDRKRHAVRLKK